MRKLPLLFLSCCCAARAFSQSNVPDAAQQQALDKLTFAVKTVFNKLNSADWILRNDYYTPQMMLSGQQQGAPFGVNNNYGRVYVIKDGSPTFQKLIQPLLDRKKAMLIAQHTDSAAMMDKWILVLSRFEVHANLNQARVNAGANGKTSTYENLSIKGCACASKVSGSNSLRSARTHYHLLIGSWDTGQCGSASHNVVFKFKHLANTPYIENVDIDIIGDNDFIDNFVKNSDWAVVETALTR